LTVSAEKKIFVSNILRLLATRSASLTLEWAPPSRWQKETWKRWQETLKEDLEMMGVDWSDAIETAILSVTECAILLNCLPVIMPDGDNLSPDAPSGMGGTKS